MNTRGNHALIMTAVTALAVFALLIRLGLWQLDRAQEKKVRAADYETRFAAPPVHLDGATRHSFADLRWRRVSAAGRYIAPVILLDNRTRRGRAGFEVLTFYVIDKTKTVLVNRGWVPGDPDRSRLPDVGIPAAPAVLSGFAGPPPVTGIALNETAALIENLVPDVDRVQRVTIEDFAAYYGVALEPFIVYLDESAPAGYNRQWNPPGDGSAKHHAYAIQWFSMAAILVVIMVALAVRRKNMGVII